MTTAIHLNISYHIIFKIYCYYPDFYNPEYHIVGNEALSARIHIYIFQQMRPNRVIVAMVCWFGYISLVDILLAF